MDKSTWALFVGGLVFSAGVFRFIQRFIHIAWHGSEQVGKPTYDAQHEASAPHV